MSIDDVYEAAEVVASAIRAFQIEPYEFDEFQFLAPDFLMALIALNDAPRDIFEAAARSQPQEVRLGERAAQSYLQLTCQIGNSWRGIIVWAHEHAAEFEGQKPSRFDHEIRGLRNQINILVEKIDGRSYSVVNVGHLIEGLKKEKSRLNAEHLSEKSRLAERPAQISRRTCRLAVEIGPNDDFVTCDGTNYSVNDAAAKLIERMIETHDWVSAESVHCRSRDLDKLPACIRDLLQRESAKGCRLWPEAWLD